MANFSQESMIKSLIKKHNFHSEVMNDFLKVPDENFDINDVIAVVDEILKDAVRAAILRSAIENENLTKPVEDSDEDMMERHRQKMSDGLHEVAHLDRSALDWGAS